jgi:hypothetical protein
MSLATERVHHFNFTIENIYEAVGPVAGHDNVCAGVEKHYFTLLMQQLYVLVVQRGSLHLPEVGGK